MRDDQDEQLIGEVTAAMAADADAAFPADRLARQQARILQRIDQEGRPGRVITFPAAPQSAPRRSLLRTSSTTRWVAAAATIAFIAGILAGQRLPYQFRGPAASQVAATGAATVPGPSLRSAAPRLSDDEFLGELEMAAQSRATVLQHIDALTPRAWEVAAAHLP
jgi:hypothetical protein